MKTTKTIKTCCALIGAASVLSVPSLFAGLSVTLLQDTSSYSFGDGGEFRAIGNADLNNVVDFGAYSAATSGLANGQLYFQTFCTELNEEFAPGTTYPVSSIGYNALYNNTGHPVPITLGVAYLYSQFAAGTLAGYDYTYGAGRSATAGDLQNAIWTLLGEQGTPLAGWIAADLSGIANPLAASNGAFGVADLTLGAPGAVQDQLVIVPEPSTIIAGALLLLPLGVSALRIVRKNRIA